MSLIHVRWGPLGEGGASIIDGGGYQFFVRILKPGRIF
jgi:hypothetical protein